MRVIGVLLLLAICSTSTEYLPVFNIRDYGWNAGSWFVFDYDDASQAYIDEDDVFDDFY